MLVVGLERKGWGGRLPHMCHVLSHTPGGPHRYVSPVNSGRETPPWTHVMSWQGMSGLAPCIVKEPFNLPHY